jgi:predicted HAD superfamily Cof-like phosphohydrolase
MSVIGACLSPMNLVAGIAMFERLPLPDTIKSFVPIFGGLVTYELGTMHNAPYYNHVFVFFATLWLVFLVCAVQPAAYGLAYVWVVATLVINNGHLDVFHDHSTLITFGVLLAYIKVTTNMFALIAEFTAAAGNKPTTRRPMSLEETEFLAKMLFDECFELLVTRSSPDRARAMMFRMVLEAENPKKCVFDDENAVLIEQADAMIDLTYYIGDSAARVGIELGPCFDEVHRSNMAKRNPVSGVFDRRPDGKIIKPPGWSEPDLRHALNIEP